MRLIDVETLELKEFVDDNIPPYAILSHTWGQDEVSFQDLCWLNDYEYQRLAPTSLPALLSRTHRWRRNKATAIYRRVGFEKIVQSARLAEEKRLRYVWVDTCCIDKSSATELSEAINSMFRWYKESVFCFAFLSDVRRRARTRGLFRNSRWFTRGWTLQELLAPREVLFYDKYWAFIGSRKSLSIKIQDITGIPIEKLDVTPLDHFALAVKLGWARKRTTSRKEDIAYCLMGIFDIQMPLLYGEGENAFIRLQQEIVKKYSGQSLFAWGCDETVLVQDTFFAPSPGYIGSIPSEGGVFSHRRPFQLNNVGLEISLEVFQLPDVVVGWFLGYTVYYALWNRCSREDSLRVSLGVPHDQPYLFCSPLLGTLDDEKGKEDVKEVFRSPSGPLKIDRKHIPHDKISHRRLLISRPSFHLNPLACFNLLPFRIQLDSLYDLLPSARLLEVYPPAVQMQTDESNPAATAAPQFWVSCGETVGPIIFRFLVCDNMKGEIGPGDRSRQFVVVVDHQRRSVHEKNIESIYCVITGIEWINSLIPTDATEEKEHEGETLRFLSMVDAAFAGVPLLEAKMWSDNPTAFLVRGRPLVATTAVQNVPFDIGFSLGKKPRGG